MCICDREATGCVTLHLDGVTVLAIVTCDDPGFDLLHTVFDFQTVTFFIKVFECSRPMIAFAQFQCFTGILVICQQFHADRLRSDAVFIVLVIPDFRYVHPRLAR